MTAQLALVEPLALARSSLGGLFGWLGNLLRRRLNTEGVVPWSSLSYIDSRDVDLF